MKLKVQKNENDRMSQGNNTYEESEKWCCEYSVGLPVFSINCELIKQNEKLDN